MVTVSLARPFKVACFSVLGATMTCCSKVPFRTQRTCRQVKSSRVEGSCCFCWRGRACFVRRSGRLFSPFFFLPFSYRCAARFICRIFVRHRFTAAEQKTCLRLAKISLARSRGDFSSLFASLPCRFPVFGFVFVFFFWADAIFPFQSHLRLVPPLSFL